ncbi:MAG: hypothetical protein NTZ56_13720 [Acidobacteria bacterium]|nr:hypothetical protein [Acidobacteriota bacterium]
MIPDWWLDGWLQLKDTLPPESPLLLIRWLLQWLLMTALVALSDLLAGAAVLRAGGVRLPARLRGAAMLAIGMGLSGTAMLFYPRGWVGLLPGLLGLPLLRTRAGRFKIFGWLSAFRPRGWAAWALVPVVLLSLPDLFLPIVEYDATMYHMVAARQYQETGRVGVDAGIRFSSHPQLGVLLYARQQMLLGEDSLTKLVNLEWVAMVLLAVMQLARRARGDNRLRSGLACLLLTGSPLFWHLAKIEYADLALTAWLAVAVALLEWRGVPAWLAGLALGLAAASKMQGLLMAGLVGLLYLPLRRRLRPAIEIAAAASLVNLGWWVRSWLATGSPVYPFLSADGRTESAYLFEVSARYGVGHDGVNFLRLPWDLLTHSPFVFTDTFVFGPALLLVPLLALASSPRWLPLATSAVYLGFWYLTGQVGRYLVPVLPLLAMGLGAAPPKLMGRAVQGLLTVWAAFAGLSTLATIRFHALPPVTFGQKTEYLRQTLPYSSAVIEINRVAQPADLTYLWFAEDARYYVRSRAEGDWFGSHSFAQATSLHRLREWGVRYVLIDRDRAAYSGRIYGPQFGATALVKRFGPVPAGLTLIYDDERYSVFRID